MTIAEIRRASAIRHTVDAPTMFGESENVLSVTEFELFATTPSGERLSVAEWLDICFPASERI